MFGVVHLSRIRSVLIVAWVGDSYGEADGPLTTRSLTKGAGELGAAQVELLCRDGVPRFHNKAAALDGNKVADGGEVWRHFAQQVAKCAHCSGEAQLLFKAEGACRLREQPRKPLWSPFSRALRTHVATVLPWGTR